MIDGVTILNQTTEYGIPEIAAVFLIVDLIAFVVAVVSAINDFDVASGIAALIALLCVGSLVACITIKLPEKAYQQYQVIISDDVNFKDFSAKYNIIKQEGQIYTITEKTDKE